MPEEKEQARFKPLSLWNYLTYFLLALTIEFIALFPIFSNLGMRHASGAPVSNWEFYSLILIFILHLPTILIAWILEQLVGAPMILFAPIMQIIFWTFLFIYFGRRKRLKSK